MSKIFYIIGPSSSGKDTIYRRILEDVSLGLNTVTLYTTRPIRSGECEGVEYYFTNVRQLEEFQAIGKVIEVRSYDTMHGRWDYFTVDNGEIAINEKDYLMVGVIESFLKTKEYFGSEKVIPLYIEVEDGVRLQRALDRERSQENPKYKELCRRYLADAEDFSKDKLQRANIIRKFPNDQLECCIQEIVFYIKEQQMK